MPKQETGHYFIKNYFNPCHYLLQRVRLSIHSDFQSEKKTPNTLNNA